MIWLDRHVFPLPSVGVAIVKIVPECSYCREIEEDKSCGKRKEPPFQSGSESSHGSQPVEGYLAKEREAIEGPEEKSDVGEQDLREKGRTKYAEVFV